MNANSDLGSRDINGEDCRGTLVEKNVPSGAVGNRDPFTIEHETWACQKHGIKFIVLTIVRNPMIGTIRQELNNIRLVEVSKDKFSPGETYKRKPRQ